MPAVFISPRLISETAFLLTCDYSWLLLVSSPSTSIRDVTREIWVYYDGQPWCNANLLLMSYSSDCFSKGFSVPLNAFEIKKVVKHSPRSFKLSRFLLFIAKLSQFSVVKHINWNNDFTTSCRKSMLCCPPSVPLPSFPHSFFHPSIYPSFFPSFVPSVRPSCFNSFLPSSFLPFLIILAFIHSFPM